MSHNEKKKERERERGKFAEDCTGLWRLHAYSFPNSSRFRHRATCKFSLSKTVAVSQVCANSVFQSMKDNFGTRRTNAKIQSQHLCSASYSHRHPREYSSPENVDTSRGNIQREPRRETNSRFRVISHSRVEIAREVEFMTSSTLGNVLGDIFLHPTRDSFGIPVLLSESIVRTGGPPTSRARQPHGPGAAAAA